MGFGESFSGEGEGVRWGSGIGGGGGRLTDPNGGGLRGGPEEGEFFESSDCVLLGVGVGCVCMCVCVREREKSILYRNQFTRGAAGKKEGLEEPKSNGQ